MARKDYSKNKYLVYEFTIVNTKTGQVRTVQKEGTSLADAKGELRRDGFLDRNKISNEVAPKLIGQKVEVTTRSKGKKSTKYEIVPVDEEPGRRAVDTRSAADIAAEKAMGIGGGGDSSKSNGNGGGGSAVSLDQALANLRSGGLKGGELAAAETVLRNKYKDGTPNSSGSGGSGSGGSGSGGSSGGSSDDEDDDEFELAELEAQLKNSGLPADQQAAIRALYDAISTNDKAKMDGYVSALKAGLELGDPVFKAQSRVILDELDRTLKGKEDDVEYRENQLRTTLQDLQKDISTSAEYLTLEEANDLRALERNFGEELTVARDDLAGRGLTSSSIRSRKEDLLSEAYGDMRESKKRSYRQQQESLTDRGTRGVRDTQAEIDRLQELLGRSRTDLIGEAEKEVGSDAIKEAGYSSVFGKLPGNIAQKKYDYADDFARSFVF